MSTSRLNASVGWVTWSTRHSAASAEVNRIAVYGAPRREIRANSEGASRSRASANSIRELAYTCEFMVESIAANSTMFSTVDAPGMPRWSRVAANGLSPTAALFHGSSSTTTDSEPR